MVATKDDCSGRRLLQGAMESEAYEPLRVRDAGEHEVGDARVNEVEVGKVADGDGLERVVPGVMSRKVGSQN